MPPNSLESNAQVIGCNGDKTGDQTKASPSAARKSNNTAKWLWPNIIIFAIAHLLAVYGVYRIFTTAHWLTTLWTFFLYYISNLGITAGMHRLWSHRSYRATTPMRVMLAIFATIAHQNSIIYWAREHRVHHKFVETDADPVNATRGIFFAHIGWLCVPKHADVLEKGKLVDITDLLNDPLLRFQRRHYVIGVLALSIAMPWLVPVYGWNETWTDALCLAVGLRWVCTLHATWLVNSAAHKIGSKPYDATIGPTENPAVSLFALGEGFHNFHHTFPWDYKTSEYGNPLNPTKVFIDLCARIGWAHELKTVSAVIVERRKNRTGEEIATKHLWGWGDAEQDEEERRVADVLAKKK